MFKRLLRLLSRKKKDKIPLYLFAVETHVMLDENTRLDTFTSFIHAESKRDAKWQIKRRAYIKVGAVANRHAINRFREKLNGKQSNTMNNEQGNKIE